MPAADDTIWMDVLPSMRGFAPALAKGTSVDATKVGKATGGKFGKAMLAGVAVVAGGAVLATKALYNVGKTFDEMSDTIRVGTGATGKTFDGLVKSAKNVGREVPASFEDVGTTIADLNTRLGLTGPTLEKLSKQFLEAGRITGEALNIKDVTAAFSAFGVEGEDTTKAMDNLFRISQATGVGMNELAGNMARNGVIAKELGFNFEDTASLMGVLDKAGVNSKAVMSSLSAGLVRLTKDGEKPAAAFKRVTGELQGLIDGGKDAEAVNLAGKMFGTRGAAQMIAALKSGKLNLEDMAGAAGMSSDTILDVANETADMTEHWQIFKNRAMVAVEPVASRVFRLLSDGMEWMNRVGTPALQKFGKWVQKNSSWLKPMGIALGVIVGVLAAYAAIMKVVTVVTAAWNAVLAMNPIGLVVVALIALVAALVLAYQKSETFRAIVDAAWAGIEAAVALAWDGYIKPALAAFSKFITTELMPVIRNLWNDVVKPVFSGLGTTIKFAWDRVIKPVFQALGSFIEDKVAPAFRRGVSAIETAWNGIEAVAKKPVNFVIDTVYNNGLRAGFNKVAGALKLDEKYKLKKMDKVGSGSGGRLGGALGGGGGARGTGARAPVAHRPQAAMGGIGDRIKGLAGKGFDWVKDIAGKGWEWAKKKIMSPVTSALGKVGHHPFAQMAKGAGKKTIDGTMGWLKDKFFGAQESGAGVMGAAGSVLSKGAYRIGMPYLGYPGHYGADYPAATNTQVRAMAGGTVTKAMSMAGSYGKHVFLQHPGGVQTRYAHLNSYNVLPGQTVRAGQVIGGVGSTGNSTGPHLHFEYRKNGEAKNPAGLGIFDNGGLLKQGMLAYHAAAKPDRVLTDAQWRDMHTLATQGTAQDGQRITGTLDMGNGLSGFVDGRIQSASSDTQRLTRARGGA